MATVYIIFQDAEHARRWARWAATKLARQRHERAARTRMRRAGVLADKPSRRAPRRISNVETVWTWGGRVFARTSANGDVAASAREFGLPVLRPDELAKLWGGLPPSNRPEQPPEIVPLDLDERVQMMRKEPESRSMVPEKRDLLLWAALAAGAAATYYWLF